jgi:lysylphosphatidylglycerol synthetase-like protein (DUF2156 family)
MKVSAQEMETERPIISFTQRNNERFHIVELVRRWAGLATDALLDPKCQYFQIPEIEGFIGYRIECGCAVVFGDPVCAPDDTFQLAHAFHQFCQTQCRNIIYLTASESFAKASFGHICQAVIEWGEEIFLDPYCNPKERQGTHASLVRRKLRHAQQRGVSVKEYIPFDAAIEHKLEQVGIDWLKSRKGPQIHISHIHLFDDRLGKRWFYAQKEDQIIGTVVLNQLKARQGWHMNHLMITPDAPNGTPELLVVSVLEILQNEDCSFVSVGAAPADALGTIDGLSAFSSWVARQAYHIAGKVFHLKGHKMFWGKFHPQTRPSYLVFSQPRIGIRETLALMRAMNVSFYR